MVCKGWHRLDFRLEEIVSEALPEIEIQEELPDSPFPPPQLQSNEKI